MSYSSNLLILTQHLIFKSLSFSIRTVVNSGKICVLNLQPSSLPSIHESDLKPYVVIIIIIQISVVHGLIKIMFYVLIGVSQPGLSSGVQAARRQAGSSVQGENVNSIMREYFSLIL